jgi:hypothetical protein
LEALNADQEDITPLATLHRDLGAESIDLLDIEFRLEREFGVHIERDELFPASVSRRPGIRARRQGNGQRTGLLALSTALC